MAKKLAHQVNITVLYVPAPASDHGPAPSRRWLRRVALSGIRSAVLARECLGDSPVQMGLVITDDDTLRRLNQEYRGADEVTDVLSFAWDHEGHWEGEDEPPPSGATEVPWPADATLVQDHHPLGEVVISYPQARRQAEARGADTEDELALLIVHGVLHLAGFDHLEPEEEAQMKAREAEALRGIRKNSSKDASRSTVPMVEMKP